MRRPLLLLLAPLSALAAWGTVEARQASRPHNVIIFVADGLRYGAVTADSAPAFYAVQREGVDFRNSHSLYPTITTPNASAIATGHRIGDTGDFGNSVYLGPAPLEASAGSLIANLETDPTLGEANARFEGDYLNETTLLEAARAQGYSTAAIGKLGPTAIQDVTARDGRSTIVVDDSTGSKGGLPLAPEIAAALTAAGLPTAPPSRGVNNDQGTSTRPGAYVSNRNQQAWFTALTTQVVLPRFKASAKPFVIVYWSRDPDGTQHSQGDSLNALTPGINGPTSKAAIRNASDNLQALRDTLKRLGLDKSTDILVTADHGFSTISKQSQTSPSARRTYPDVPAGFIPPGFLAVDLGEVLGLPVFEPNGTTPPEGHTRRGHAVLGKDPADPEVVIGANGGSDLIWLPGGSGVALVRRIVEALVQQDYAGAIFVRDDLGPIPGTLPMSAVGLKGSARTPSPAIMMAFRSFSTGCERPELCSVDISDSDLQQGQGTHGAFGRGDTRNFMAAVGPSFKARFADPVPVSNADLAHTAARILGLRLAPKGSEMGRVIAESLKGGKVPASRRDTIRSAPAANGFVTVLNRQHVGATPYFDAAGDPGRTLGLRP